MGKPLPENAVYTGATLFLAGANSGYIDAMDEILIKKHFPVASVVVISNAGHWLHAENPKEFYDRVRRFISEKDTKG